jgi:hypothetical protein
VHTWHWSCNYFSLFTLEGKDVQITEDSLRVEDRRVVNSMFTSVKVHRCLGRQLRGPSDDLSTALAVYERSLEGDEAPDILVSSAYRRK